MQPFRQRKLHLLEMNFYYNEAVISLDKWRKDPSDLIDGTGSLWNGVNRPEIYKPYMDSIREHLVRNSTVAVIKEMAAAGLFKLKFHAEEHLPGGLYANPTAAMQKVATDIGDATNDRIESMFGMLDRHMMIAPSSNPVNVSSLIAAKRDRPVEWLNNTDLQKENVYKLAMKHASRKRKIEGTKTEQLKRRYEVKKAEKQGLILKRRRLRKERERKMQEHLNNADTKLPRNTKKVDSLKKNAICEQFRIWKAVNSIKSVKNIDNVKGISSKSLRVHLIKANKHLKLNISSGKTAQNHFVDDSDDYNSSDEEFLDMMRPVLKLVNSNVNMTNDTSSSEHEPLAMMRPLSVL